MMEGISKPLHQDSVVLTFEYKSTQSIERMQFFFGPTISEDRSVFGPTMSVLYMENLLRESGQKR
jgi:hypothetical protein